MASPFLAGSLRNARAGQPTIFSPHAPIYISDDSGFTQANGVTRGSGTQDDPYVIEGWDIDSSLTGIGAIVVRDVSSYFIIRNVHLHSLSLSALGIMLTRTHDAVIRDSIVEGFDWGIAFDTSTKATVIDNIVTYTPSAANFGYGIDLYHTNQSIVTGNNVSTQTAGIFLDSSSNVTVNGNAVHDQVDIGVYGYSADNNLIIGNNVSNSGMEGVRLYLSNRNLVYHNNLVNNGANSPTGQVLDSPTGVAAYDNETTTNRWDDGYPEGGNYYSVFPVQDKCAGVNQTLCSGLYSDGLSDGPKFSILDRWVNSISTIFKNYTIGYDNYPLTGPYSSSTVLPGLSLSTASVIAYDGTSTKVSIWLSSVHDFTDNVSVTFSTDAPAGTILAQPVSVEYDLLPRATVTANVTLTAAGKASPSIYTLNATATAASGVTFELEVTVIVPATIATPATTTSFPQATVTPPSPWTMYLYWLSAATVSVLVVFLSYWWKIRRTL